MPAMRSVLVAISFVLVLAITPTFTANAEVDRAGEEQPQGRSSFWGSNTPAKHGAYRWRLLGIGVGLLGITGFVMLRLVRKARAEREARGGARPQT